MGDPQHTKLIEVVHGLADKVRHYRKKYIDHNLGEQNTKASLIEPLLEALGWNTQEPDEVYREFRPSPKDNPVDYCLRLQRETRLLIEAKGLGEEMVRRYVAQTLGYAVMAGARWCVLTDGDEYLFYNATELVDADRKLFCQIKLSDGKDEEAANVLSLMSKSNVEKDVLYSLWKEHFIDRRVKGALREMVDNADAKSALVQLVHEGTVDVTEEEIVASLRRLEISIEAPPSPYKPSVVKPVKQQESGKKQEASHGSPGLADLIAAGIIPVPLELFSKFKGKSVEAELLPDGHIKFKGVPYATCSQAAANACASITGKATSINGWAFWQYRGPGGKPVTLDDARKRFVKAKTPPAKAPATKNWTTSGQGIADHIAANQPPAHIKPFTDLQLKKIAALNPDGIKDCKITVPRMIAGTQTAGKGAEDWAKGKLEQQAKIDYLKSLLPAGTEVQIKRVTSEELEELPDSE